MSNWCCLRQAGLLNDVYENARVLSEDYDATGRIMTVRGLPARSRGCAECCRLVSSIADRRRRRHEGLSLTRNLR